MRIAAAIGFRIEIKRARRTLRERLAKVLDRLMDHTSAWTSVEIINPTRDGAIDYYYVVDEPEDLVRMMKKLEKKVLVNNICFGLHFLYTGYSFYWANKKLSKVDCNNNLSTTHVRFF